MSKKSEPDRGPSFLDRLARFVRHPTTDWTATQLHAESRFDTAKGTAQRREAQRMARAGVLILEREFDALRREMRNRNSKSAEMLEGLSLPPTLPPPHHAVSRRHTLHKIDAIERQIQDEQHQQRSTTLPGGMLHRGGAADGNLAASTLRPGALRRGTASRSGLSPGRPQPALPNGARSTSLPSPWGQAVLPVPTVLELAAFDFAEGRDAQVESQLLTSLQAEPDPDTVLQVFQALLDFYWATGQHDKLQSRSLDYVQRYGQTPMPRPELDTCQFGQPRTASWFAAEQFDLSQLRAFERFAADRSAHLVLDWTALVSIPAPQRAPLAQALQTLNDRPVELELFGADMLCAATRLQSSPAKPADAALRLQVLRHVGDETGFVDLAVELAIACACSPVDWSPPRFKCTGPAERGATTLHGEHRQPPAGMQTGHGEAGFVQATARVSGELSGAGESFLRGLRAQAQQADAITVELHAVQRMDFSAAINLLNWIDAQTQLGKAIELRGAHALLIPFLQSVGLQANV